MASDAELRQQRRNVLVYAALMAAFFLSAPALYVGFVQASLSKRLAASDTLANLPSTVYLSMAWFPVVAVWLFPAARSLKPLLSTAYATIAAVCVGVAIVLLTGSPGPVILGTLAIHAAVLGCANGVVLTCHWEALNRGVGDRLRGRAFGLAFGLGAAFAVVGSLGAQLLLDGSVLGWRVPPGWLIAYPRNYAALFGVGGLLMGLCAFVSRLYAIPMPEHEATRQRFLVAMAEGFKALLAQRTLAFACLGYLLVYAGNMVQVNLNLFTHEAVGRAPEDLVGYQLALRFSAKIVAGLVIAWVLARTSPKVPLLITTALEIAGILWALFVPGYWFLLAFGLNGAGELFGVYFVNYAVSCAPKAATRRNTSFLYLVSSLVGFAPVIYGRISDAWGLRASFWTALGVLLFAGVMVAVMLPARPQVPQEPE
ncbi:MAG: hypothetical protein JWM32_2421 [Verrucomicrobia bacterium]|nr:hypothetical protein [Verrucomicrobiota bacterium]